MTSHETFWSLYEKTLADFITANPDDYCLLVTETPESFAKRVATKMRANRVNDINTNTKSFRATMRKLSIKPSRKALAAYLGE